MSPGTDNWHVLGESLLENVRSTRQAAAASNILENAQTPIQEKLSEIYRHVLNLERVGIHDNFFELGGDSLLAARLFAEIETTFGHKLPSSVLFQTPTIQGLAEELRTAGGTGHGSPLVPIQPHGARAPLFYFPPHNALVGFHLVAETLGTAQPVYGLLASPRGDHNPFSSIQDEAAYYVEQICALQPDGPYYLTGWSYGGMTAFETAQQLLARGKTIAFLGILDTGLHFNDWRERLAYYRRCLAYLTRTSVRDQFALVLNHIRFHTKLARTRAVTFRRMAETDPTHFRENDYQGDLIRILRYKPLPYPGRVVLFRARSDDPHRTQDPLKGWGRIARGGVEVHDLSTDHNSILDAPHVQDLTEKFRAALVKAQNEFGG